MEKLLPCPFCGGKAMIKVMSNGSSHSGVGFTFTVECTNCKLTLPKNYYIEFIMSDDGEIKTYSEDEREKAIKSWNTREKGSN